MDKAELKEMVESRLKTTHSPQLLGLMLSFVFQCETATVEVDQFLRYLKKNLLRIVKDQLPYRPQDFLELITGHLAVHYEEADDFKLSHYQLGVYGKPVIHIAAERKDIATIEALVKSGADINLLHKIDKMGCETPFMHLVIYNRLNSTQTESHIKKMIELGADIYFKNDSNQTALDVALNRYPRFYWIRSLLKHGVSFNQENARYFSESDDSSSYNDVEKLLREAKAAELKNPPVVELIIETIKTPPEIAHIIGSYMPQFGYFKNNKRLFAEEEEESTPQKIGFLSSFLYRFIGQ